MGFQVLTLYTEALTERTEDGATDPLDVATVDAVFIAVNVSEVSGGAVTIVPEIQDANGNWGSALGKGGAGVDEVWEISDAGYYRTAIGEGCIWNEVTLLPEAARVRWAVPDGVSATFQVGVHGGRGK
jgi:hypothetical protein